MLFRLLLLHHRHINMCTRLYIERHLLQNHKYDSNMCIEPDVDSITIYRHNVLLELSIRLQYLL